MAIEKREPNDKCRIITSTLSNKIYNIYLSNELDDPDNYIDAFNIFRTAEEGDDINLYINSPGGVLATVYQFITAIKQCKTRVCGYIDGVAHSAAGMIFLTCHSQAIPHHCDMMVHFYSGGCSGKGNENIKQIEFDDGFVREVYTSVYKDFLSTDELAKIFNGEDFWFNSKEIDKRLRYKYKKLNEGLDKKDAESKCKEKNCKKICKTKRSEN